VPEGIGYCAYDMSLVSTKGYISSFSIDIVGSAVRGSSKQLTHQFVSLLDR
jgi:hypothetical protein